MCWNADRLRLDWRDQRRGAAVEETCRQRCPTDRQTTWLDGLGGHSGSLMIMSGVGRELRGSLLEDMGRVGWRREGQIEKMVQNDNGIDRCDEQQDNKETRWVSQDKLPKRLTVKMRQIIGETKYYHQRSQRKSTGCDARSRGNAFRQYTYIHPIPILRTGLSLYYPQRYGNVKHGGDQRGVENGAYAQICGGCLKAYQRGALTLLKFSYRFMMRRERANEVV